MTVTTLSSREFCDGSDEAKKIATTDGPVFITDDGLTSHVLLSYDEYRRITGKPRSIIEALAMPGLDEVDIEFPRSKEKPRNIDFDFD